MEDVSANSGVPIMYQTGHSFIKNKLKKEKALLAGEMSGHFYFADNYLGYDDGIFASLRMVELLANSCKKMSELLDTIPKYYNTPEIRVECPDDKKFKIVEEISKELEKKGLDVLTIDGARVQYGDGWGLIRASNTTPKLILRFEAKTQKRLEEIKKTILDELEKHMRVDISS
jgi:phosphomannomutase/phosphoglucomutase